MNIDPNSVTLSAYLNSVQQVIKTHCADAVWVRAEITNCNSKGGHYYLELAEKDPDTHQRVAATKATIWQFVARRIITKFEKETGIKFGKDINVLVKLKASFSSEYGFSLNIDDIDSNFTVGDIAKKYLEIRNRLISEGLIDLNRALPTPFDFENVLVIAPENAAGLGDFKKDADVLEKHGVCHFYYHHCLFQGKQAPIAIQETLKVALKGWCELNVSPPDIIVIIRGGGTINDLAYLNDYDLAALLCKRKVPVWVGIGHERDKTILDEVAHRSFDTPSKVITCICNIIEQNTKAAKALYQQIGIQVKNQILFFHTESDKLELKIRHNALTQLAEVKLDVDSLSESNQYFALQSIKNAMQLSEQFFKKIGNQAKNQVHFFRTESDKFELKIRHNALFQSTEVKRDVESLSKNNQYFALQSIKQTMQLSEQYFKKIGDQAKNQVHFFRTESDKFELKIRHYALTQSAEVNRDIDSLSESNQHFALQSIKQAKRLIEQYLKETLLQSPRKTLDRGYAIIRIEGRAVFSIHQLKNKKVSIELHDGTVDASIN